LYSKKNLLFCEFFIYFKLEVINFVKKILTNNCGFFSYGTNPKEKKLYRCFSSIIFLFKVKI